MRLHKFFIAAACALSVIVAPAVRAQSTSTDSITPAAASILGYALKGSIENIENLGCKLDRPALMQMLEKIVNGEPVPYSYDHAYAIIDAHVAQLQNAYVDSVFSVEAQQQFIDSVAAVEGVVTTPSGLVFQTIVEGEGVTPVSGDDVVLTYVGSFSDGSVFDETEQPVRFDVDRLVPGFTEALKMMRPGGKYHIVIPAKLGYGERGIPGNIPPNAALDFRIDLLQVVPKPSVQ